MPTAAHVAAGDNGQSEDQQGQCAAARQAPAGRSKFTDRPYQTSEVDPARCLSFLPSSIAMLETGKGYELSK